MPKTIPKYGTEWTGDMTGLDIEMHCIRKGGKWVNKKGNDCGEGLFHHYKAMMSLLWPEDDHHRWSDLGLKRILENEIIIFMGASDSSKTYTVSKFVLCDWWAFADNTLWMVSSTELRGAELRIWGSIKTLFNSARERYPDLPGHVVDSKHCITTENISDDGSEARTLTKGIIFIPCKTGHTWVGLGAYAGIKPPKNGRLGHAGDEVSFMQSSFLQAYSNWYGKANFKGLLTGNPLDLTDCLCTAAEPVEGWENWKDTEKTQEWRSRFYNAWVIALDGRDSPNFDHPEFELLYPYLIGPKKINAVKKANGEDSPLFWTMCVGKPRPGAEQWRVITVGFCRQHNAFDDVKWKGNKLTRIVSLDAAYGGVGGDRCVLTDIAFGLDINGKNILFCFPFVIVPVSVKKAKEPDIQIAEFCKEYCETRQIAAANFFFDGRSSLAIAMAKTWSADVNVVDFGGAPTERPVSLDEYIWEGDKKTRRLKKCNEHYSKFVTELWFTVRYLILSGQMRGLSTEVAEEGAKRIWRYVKGSKIEVESKVEMKERTTYSPDLFDSLVTAVEGARRRGFEISRLAPDAGETPDNEWLRGLRDRSRRLVERKTLTYS